MFISSFILALAPIDGGFSEWGAWTACSTNCGDGVKHRYIFCSDPYPMYGGASCEGDMVEQMSCNDGSCPGEEKLILKEYGNVF